MTVIKDGSGTGFLAKVGAGNDLHVLATVFAEISAASGEGAAFEAEGETTITAATEKTVLLMINDGDDALEIGNIFISIKNDTVGIITVVKMYIGQATHTAGGTEKAAKNLNTGSVNTPEVQLYEDNPTVGGTDTKILELYFQLGDGSNETIPFDGGISLAKNGSFRVTVTGGAGASGTLTCDSSFQFWLERDI